MLVFTGSKRERERAMARLVEEGLYFGAPELKVQAFIEDSEEIMADGHGESRPLLYSFDSYLWIWASTDFLLKNKRSLRALSVIRLQIWGSNVTPCPAHFKLLFQYD